MTPTPSCSTGSKKRVGRMFLDKGERKKVKILAGLVAVALLVVGLQVLKKAGPSVAQAASEEAASGRTTLETALQQMRQELMPMTPGADGMGVCSVEESLAVFLGGKKMKGGSLESLSPNVFGVPEEFKTPPVPDQDAGTAAESADSADSHEPEVDPHEEAFAKLQLEICMVSTRNRAAIVNGRILHCGETVDGFTVIELPKPKKLSHRKGTVPIRAWRKWRIKREGEDFFMHAIFKAYRWDGPIIRANGKPSEQQPSTDETQMSEGEVHGIYAYPLISGPMVTANGVTSLGLRSLNQVYFGQALRMMWDPGPEPTYYVEGEVELIGKVVVHERGYRAEAARVVRLSIREAPTEWFREGLIAKLADRYQCPVEVGQDPDWDNLGVEEEPSKITIPEEPEGGYAVLMQDIHTEYGATYGHR